MLDHKSVRHPKAIVLDMVPCMTELDPGSPLGIDINSASTFLHNREHILRPPSGRHGGDSAG